ncbi:AMP-binding protein [Demequina sp. TTPB684]|uniref:AMP-binding protein n=1 Tax=unclassified Demequina TaxID=2620311 RepID=UPI001CF28809|nr:MULTISPECIES: AMP-binding protein [unclassified Demequina]MCB2413787.1 AMP-binding protein [Demequina sp. TTPB684]UPU89305.1 AMP-binding protein [Demequina sp. TMPB413]
MTTPTQLPSNDPVGSEDRPWFNFYAPEVARRVPDLTESSLSDMLRDTAERHRDAVAFSNMGGTLSFNDVDRLATQFAAFLQSELGLGKGDRIVIQMPNLLQYPVALFGALRAGLIVVNANPLYTHHELARVVADSQPRAIVVLANFADKVQRVLPGSTIEHVVVTQVADLLPQPRRSVINFAAAKIKKMVPDFDIPDAVTFTAALDRGSRADFIDPAVQPSDIAFLQYTGGTTGGPKAAVLTHWNLLNNQEQFMGQVRNTLGEERQSTVIAALPLYHVFALTVNCLGFFRFGAHNVLITNPRDLKGFVKTLKKSRPDGLILVSTLAGALLDAPGFSGDDLRDCRITVAGGMAVRSSVAERWKAATGADIIEGYGLTEASPVVSVNPTHMPPRVGTIGVPLPSTDVQILDDERRPVPHGSPGELAVKGPQVMQGYWNRPEETSACLTDDGWLLTGDIAVLSEDGFLSIVDRKKEMILVSGFNVYPAEIEEAAMLHPGVAEAGAIAVPDEHSGELPKLFVARRDPHLTEDALRAHLKQHLAGYKRPRYIVFLEELPKTNVGKVLRRALVDAENAGPR